MLFLRNIYGMILLVINMKHNGSAIIGIKIKEQRKAKKMTQDELAKLLREKYGLKTTRPMVGKWEIGYQTPEMYTIKCIADILGVTIDYLTDSASQKKQPAEISELSEQDKEIISLIANLSEDKRKEAINYIKYISVQKQNEDNR